MIHRNFSPTFWNIIPFISREWMRNCNFKCMKSKSWIYWLCMHKESILFTEWYFKWSYLQNLCLCIYNQADVTKSLETPVVFPLLLMKQTCKEGVKYISINFSFFHIAESVFYLLLWFTHYIKVCSFSQNLKMSTITKSIQGLWKCALLGQSKDYILQNPSQEHKSITWYSGI